MNRSWHVPARCKASLTTSAAVLTVGIGLVGLMCPAVAASETESTAPSATSTPSDNKKIDFVKDVQPLFKAYCIKCHGLNPNKPKKKASARFRLDDKAAALKGGKSGVSIVPGDSKNSLLFKLLKGPVTVEHEDGDKEIKPMPKVKLGEKWNPLTDDQIALIQQWIDQGANWPDAK